VPFVVVFRQYRQRRQASSPSIPRYSLGVPTTITVIESADTFTHVQIIGPLDMAGVGSIDLKLTAATATRRKHTILDMTEVPFMASLGMGLLVQIARALTAREQRLILLTPSDTVAIAIRTSRLDTIMPIAESLEAAHGLLKA
jgi:anti-anti-sigma factor